MKVTLLKAGTFEVMLVHLACLFDSKNNTMLFVNGNIFQRTSATFVSCIFGIFAALLILLNIMQYLRICAFRCVYLCYICGLTIINKKARLWTLQITSKAPVQA